MRVVLASVIAAAAVLVGAGIAQGGDGNDAPSITFAPCRAYDWTVQEQYGPPDMWLAAYLHNQGRVVAGDPLTLGGIVTTGDSHTVHQPVAVAPNVDPPHVLTCVGDVIDVECPIP